MERGMGYCEGHIYMFLASVGRRRRENRLCGKKVYANSRGHGDDEEKEVDERVTRVEGKQHTCEQTKRESV